jgi:hypothetical protein
VTVPSYRLRLLPFEIATPRGQPKSLKALRRRTVSSYKTAVTKFNNKLIFKHFYSSKRVLRVCESKTEEQADVPVDKMDRPIKAAFSSQLTLTRICTI